jgi:hypothetical protein
MVEKTSSSFKVVVLGEGMSYWQDYLILALISHFCPQFQNINSLLVARVGKTSLTLRFCKGNFDEKQISTVDASCLSQVVTIGGGQKVTLNIWDTAGQERYHALNKVYYQGAEGKEDPSTLDKLLRCADCV